ncbi:hypothetical protein EBU02_09350 [bacterium]|nr:hypothetical protein [bacterium]
MTKSQAAMCIKLRNPLHASSFSFLTSAVLFTSAFLSACSSRQAGPAYSYGGEGATAPVSSQPAACPPANYTSSLHQTNLVSRQTVAMSDEEAAKQRAGTTRTRQTASSETVIKNGNLKKQTTTEKVENQ